MRRPESDNTCIILIVPSIEGNEKDQDCVLSFAGGIGRMEAGSVGGECQGRAEERMRDKRRQETAKEKR